MASDPKMPPPVGLELERYLLGELEPARTAALDALLDADPEFRAQVLALRAEDDATRIQYPAGRMANEIESRAGFREERKRGGWGVWVMSMAVMAVMMWVALPPNRLDHIGGLKDPALNDGVRPKGSAEAQRPDLRVYRKAAAGIELLQDGAAVSGGDVIQVAYLAGDQGHGVILSIDGAGAVSLHWPSEPGGPTALDGGGEHHLDRAWTLDEAPGFERFFFVTSPLPLDLGAMQAAAEKLAGTGLARSAALLPLRLPASQPVQQQTLLLKKEARR